MRDQNRKNEAHLLCQYRSPQDHDLCLLAQKSKRCPDGMKCGRKRVGVRGRPKGPGQSSRSQKRRPRAPIFFRGLSGIGAFPAFGGFR